MPMNIDDVKRLLAPDEVDYEAAAIALGPTALPFLRQIVAEPDVMMASKAAYLSGMLGGPEGAEIVRGAATHEQPVVRIAAASTLGMIEHDTALELAEQLWDDDAPGIRAVIAHAAATMADDRSRGRVRDLMLVDTDPSVRELANRIVGP